MPWPFSAAWACLPCGVDQPDTPRGRALTRPIPPTSKALLLSRGRRPAGTPHGTPGVTLKQQHVLPATKPGHVGTSITAPRPPTTPKGNDPHHLTQPLPLIGLAPSSPPDPATVVPHPTRTCSTPDDVTSVGAGLAAGNPRIRFRNEAAATWRGLGGGGNGRRCRRASTFVSLRAGSDAKAPQFMRPQAVVPSDKPGGRGGLRVLERRRGGVGLPVTAGAFFPF